MIYNNDNSCLNIWFWQRIVSPHMAGLAEALAKKGCNIVYVAEQLMSQERARYGWRPYDTNGIRLEIAPTTKSVMELANSASLDSIHICQGIRGNGLVSKAQKALAKRGLRQWIVMETINDAGWQGYIKRELYRRLLKRMEPHVEGILATGYRTSTWIAQRSVPSEKIYPFAYFLANTHQSMPAERDAGDPFKFIYVGRLIELKCVDQLLLALAAVTNVNIELHVIGSGVAECKLRILADRLLPGKVRWLGVLPMSDVPQHIYNADCLVLPSRHDGWGAVVSEALMVGTQAICSDKCGVADVVLKSGSGGVFESGDTRSLALLIENVAMTQRMNNEKRNGLAKWAQCLGVEAGADYLLSILQHKSKNIPKPNPPWLI